MNCEIVLGTKVVTISTVTIEGVEVELGYLESLLEELEESGWIETVVVSDEIRPVLERLGVIRTNIRGSSYRGPNFEEFETLVSSKVNGD